MDKELELDSLLDRTLLGEREIVFVDREREGYQPLL